MESNIPKPYLTRAVADSRLQVIQQGSIYYHVGLNLLEGMHLEGVVEIEVSILSAAPLPLDYQGEVKRLEVNGVEINPQPKYNGMRILLDEGLVQGKNNIKVEFRSKYSYDRDGCKTYKDSTGRQYLATCFEPFAAYRVFPCFDQPNLKAYIKFDAAAPQDWRVVSGEESTQQEEGGDYILGYLKQVDRRIHSFKRTPLLPTYLFSFAAGEYFCLSRDQSQSYKNLNTSLYCHQPMSPYLIKHSKLLWQLIDHGLQFFEHFFGYPYPFSKYETLFFGDFAVRAMENPGLIVFSDTYLFKEDVGEELMVDLGETVLHEMAHCWFGNLVTMNWWNDLWLNQSFADFMGFLCLQKIKHKVTAIKYQTAMISFLWRKQWGYLEDSYSNNHPVRSIINNTDEAMSSFDGITYSKGASILKNMVFLIGEEKFSIACHEYFNRYAWKNTEYQDFTECLEKQFDIKEFEFDVWKREWLETKGHNLLFIERVDQETILIHQSLLPHCDSLKRYKINLSVIANGVKTTHPIIIQNTPTTEIKLTGDYYILNDGDHCFVQVLIDDQSFKYFSENVSKVDNSLTRALIWMSFFKRVKMRLLPFREYINIMVSQLPHESNISVMECVLEKVAEGITNYIQHTSTSDPLREQVYDLTMYMLSKEKDAQKRKVILRCMLSTHSHRILEAFSEGKIGDTLEQKVDIAAKLMLISHSDQKHQIRDILRSRDQEASKQSHPTVETTLKHVGLSHDQKSDFLFSQVLNEDAEFTNADIGIICAALRSDSVWYHSILDEYILKLKKLVQTSLRQEYFASVLVSFCKPTLKESEINMYSQLLHSTNDKAYFASKLLKLVENHRGHLAVRE